MTHRELGLTPVDLEPVRDAYSAVSERYVGLFDGVTQAHREDVAFIRRHLSDLPGRVLDLGCGPGHWSAYLHSLGADVTGIDMVPEFIAHARSTHAGPDFRLGSMLEIDVAGRPAAGVLSWYSTIHLPPEELPDVLARFRRLLRPDGVLVIGFFDSEDLVAPFDHAVHPAYRWPVDVFAQRLAAAGFEEVERLQHTLPERPDRRYAALAARAQPLQPSAGVCRSWRDEANPSRS